MTRMGVTSLPTNVSAGLIAASLSTNSWNRYNSAVNCANCYKKVSWPMTSEYLRGFTEWALTVRNLSASTVLVYLSDLKLSHKIRNLDSNQFNDYFITAMIKGSEKLSLYTSICKRTRLVLTFPLLKLLGHEISKSNWSIDSKRVFWSACSLAFFGSFRLGEILSPKESECCQETLKWKNIQIFEDHAIVNIEIPKTLRSKKGEFVDIFPFKGCCPLSALKELNKTKKFSAGRDLPVFTFENGKFLTQETLIRTMRELLSKHIGQNAKNISGHSFRAGIPSALSDCPDLASDEDIRKWGRWNSNSFQIYTRLQLNVRRSIFVKISKAINCRST